MKRWGQKIIIISVLMGTFSGVYADVTRLFSVRKFDRLRRNSKMLVVYFYNYNNAQDNANAHFNSLQKSLRAFRHASEKEKFLRAGVKFVVVNLADGDLAPLKQKYKIDKETLLLFYRGSLYTKNRLEGSQLEKDEIEDFVEDYFYPFIKERLEQRERVAVYRPGRSVIYEYGRPLVYPGPSWGLYYSPYSYNPYWYPGGWHGYPGYGPSIGFGFSIGV
jgi:hypothetical protein